MTFPGNSFSDAREKAEGYFYSRGVQRVEEDKQGKEATDTLNPLAKPCKSQFKYCSA